MDKTQKEINDLIGVKRKEPEGGHLNFNEDKNQTDNNNKKICIGNESPNKTNKNVNVNFEKNCLSNNIQLNKPNINNNIRITINNQKFDYYSIEKKLENVAKLFQEFKKSFINGNISDNDKFKQISKILEDCEVFSEYNYYYLNLFKKCIDENNNNSYIEDKDILDRTLNCQDYNRLYNTEQESPQKDIYDLLIYCENKSKFEEKAQTIKYNNLNIPLNKSIERLRLNLYRHKITKYEDNLKNRIKEFKDLIQSMENTIKNINPDEKKINVLIFAFLSSLIYTDTNDKKIWLENYINQMLNPENQVKEINCLKLVEFVNKHIKINIKDQNKNDFLISNKFEEKSCKVNDYVIQNLIKDLLLNWDTPLDVVLKRNESFHNFSKNNPKIIEDPEIFKEFKNYFNLFIHSNLVKEVLKNEHENIIELIDSDAFLGYFFDDDYVKSLPINGIIVEGITDKDIVTSFISYFPLIISDYGIISNIEEYNNIKNVFFIFDVTYKFIISLHEILIHLSYAYLNYITEGKIEDKSPKNSKKSKSTKKNDEFNDGGSYFETLLFGTKVHSINFQLIYCLLNGEFLNGSLKHFRENLEVEFNPLNMKKTGLFGKILDKYKINFELFNYNDVEGYMRQISNEYLIAKRHSNAHIDQSNSGNFYKIHGLKK